MGKCPVCGTPTPDDFGLVECSGCGAQLILHIDGKVEHSGKSDAPATEVEAAAEAVAEDIPMPSEEPEFAAEEVVEAEPPPAEEFQEVPAEPEAPVEGPGTEFENDFLRAPEETPAPEMEASEPPPPPGPTMSDSPDLSDIALFANSDASSSRDGSLRYNLFISGIDTSDVRESFRAAITDRKLVWDTDQILRSVKNGEVSISGVSAIKAHIVVSRLKNLPVQIWWEQYAVAQT